MESTSQAPKVDAIVGETVVKIQSHHAPAVSPARQRKTWWKWNLLKGSGTMPELDDAIKGNKVLEILVIFLRSCGMFQGLNNPLTGVCCLIAAVVNSPFNLLYLFWSVSWSMVWAYVLNLPRVLIKNGVCGAQGTILGYAVYIIFDPIDLHNLPDMRMIVLSLGAMVPLTFMVMVIFNTLSRTLLEVFGVPPMFLAAIITGQMWWAMTVNSQHIINTNLYPRVLEPVRSPSYFQLTSMEFLSEVVYGFSLLQFSNTIYCSIPLTVGYFIASPLSGIMAWLGVLLGIATAILLGMDITRIRLELFGINSAITFTCLAGTFFVLNWNSFLLAIFGTFCAAFTTMAVNALTMPWGGKYFSLPSFIVVGLIYRGLDNVPGLIRVPLEEVTTIELHLAKWRAQTSQITEAEAAELTEINVNVVPGVE